MLTRAARTQVFDKYDLLGSKALPLYSWLTKALPNQWGVNRIVFDYERFLVDEKGLPLRRYPRSRARFKSDPAAPGPGVLFRGRLWPPQFVGALPHGGAHTAQHRHRVFFLHRQVSGRDDGGAAAC